MRYIAIFCCILLSVGSAVARDIAGVEVSETREGKGGTVLALNGAGIRSKLFFKIYIAQLYLEKPSSDDSAIFADEGQRTMVMHFLYDEVGKDKLVDGWSEGFAANLDQQQQLALGQRIERFNDMFTAVTKGQTIVLDYIPGTGTEVRVADQVKGVIEGKDFSDALLAIWLGEKPVTQDLKKALLSYSK